MTIEAIEGSSDLVQTRYEVDHCKCAEITVDYLPGTGQGVGGFTGAGVRFTGAGVGGAFGTGVE